MDAVYEKSNQKTLEFLNSLPPEYFQKHNLVIGSVRDTDRDFFNPLKKSKLEQAVEAVGTQVFDKLGDIR